MSSNPLQWGKDREERAEGLPHKDHERAAGAHKTHFSRRVIKTKSEEQKLQAIDDAQQGLHSLLNQPTGNIHPHIISPSGATRNHTRGRIAGPTAGQAIRSSRPRQTTGRLIEGGSTSVGDSLALVAGSLPLEVDGAPDARQVPQTALARGVARTSYHLQAVRDRANLLLNVEDTPGTLAVAGDADSLHVSRRAASQWVTRYATHIVIVLVVGALVAAGGLKTMTVQGAYTNGLQAVEAYTGTDNFGDQDLADGLPDVGSPDFELTLPRTELGGADAAANSKMQPPAPAAVQPQRQGAITRYTVVQGDTVEALAVRYNLMPETIMGSNGIYDVKEELQPGRVLIIPPLDGMYYLAQEGDTLEGIAMYYQVEPSAIVGYLANNISGGQVKAGQEVIIPGGMMPPREIAITYTVRRGDILKGIAARFGVDVPTIINSNDIPDPDNLQIGSQLRILPVIGLEYKVKKGDTVSSIADKHGVTPQMILDYSPNRLTLGSTLQVDQVIMVPGGRPEQPEIVAAARIEPSTRNSIRPPERKETRPEPPQPQESKPAPKPAPKPQPKQAPQQPAASSNAPKVGTGRMVWPVRGTITQYFSGRHNGLDIAIRAGTPIYGADAGKVIWSGWRTDGLGYCVMIDHGNGLITIYGHMIRQPPVYVGQYVSRGQVIGYIGSTGRSTGPHVHFMVKAGGGRNYRNPLSFLGR